MTTIRIPAQCAVLIVGGRRAPLAETAALLPESTACPWDVQKPDASLERLHEALRGRGLVRVCMPDSHPKARRAVASAARRRGARCVCLALPGAPDVDAAGERIDAVHAIAPNDEPRFEIEPMPSDMTGLTGPFDLIGDPHGCRRELLELLGSLGHLDERGEPRRHPEGRVPVLLGDMTDRGPDSLGVLLTARRLEEAGGVVLRGNHDEKLRLWLLGRRIAIRGGLETTIAELADTTPEWRADMAAWIDTLQPHVMLAGGLLAAAHAGIDEDHQGRHSPGAFSFGLYGKPVAGGTELDEEGYPLREDWARSYKGAATVVHGHVPYARPRVVNDVVAVDTGCVFGGSLTCYRWPEREFVSVPAHAAYADRTWGGAE
jgi:hypothetical protein